MDAFERRGFAGAAQPTTLTGDLSAVADNFSVVDGTGYPTGADGRKFILTIDRGTANEERVLVTTRSTNTFSDVERGVDGTTAKTHQGGANVEHTAGMVDFDEANALIADTTLDLLTQYLNNARHDIEARHTFGGAFGTPADPSPIGTVADDGSGGNPAKEDHVHIIGAGAINNNNMFAAGVVNAGAIGTDAVGSDEIAAGAVGPSEIATDAVGTDELADNAVAKANIQDDAVGPDEIDTANVKGTPVAATGSALAAGSATTFALSDHVHTGGIATVTSGTRPGSPYEGQFIFETDTNLIQYYDGAVWVPVNGGDYYQLRATRTTVQDIDNDSAYHTITWPTEVYDPAGGFTAGGSVYTIQKAGMYAVQITAAWSNLNAATKATILLLTTGTYATSVGSSITGGGNFSYLQNASFLNMPFDVGDTLAVQAWQNSSNNRSFTGSLVVRYQGPVPA